MVLLPFVLWCASEDALRGKIPNRIIIIAFAWSGVLYGTAFMLRFSISLLFLFSVSLLLHFRGAGGGDMKLAALICGAAGPAATARILLLSFVPAVLFHTEGVLKGKESLRTRIRLGPYMAAGYLFWTFLSLIQHGV